MTRQTPNHGWDAPEAGDPPEDWSETFEELIDNIDQETPLRGHLDNRPAPGHPYRLFLTTDENPPTLYVDVGDEWVSPATYGDPPDELLRRDREETVSAQWTFDPPQNMDITGRAATASHANTAEDADNASRLDGHRPDEFARTDRAETIEEEWEYDEPVKLAGAKVEGGVVSLPQYSGGDPTPRDLGDLWVRVDRQP